MKIGIVIPTLNEETYIARTIGMIRSSAHDVNRIEVVVIDAGSTDQTVKVAGGEQVNVWSKPAFRGVKYQSLNFGAEQLNADALLFLDADCLVPMHFDLHIEKMLSIENVVGGAFEFKMEAGGSWLYFLIQSVNRMRYRITKMYFGDQGVFCTRKAFEKVSGFPHQPIMESAYFCRELKKVGKIRLIKSSIVSSIRRFKSGGIHRVFWKDFLIWVLFWLGADISRYAAKYWRFNERRTV